MTGFVGINFSCTAKVLENTANTQDWKPIKIAATA